MTISFGRGGRVCRDVTVSSIVVGGLTRSEAAARIDAWAAERVKRRVTLTALDARWIGTLTELGVRVDTRGALDRAMAVGRKGNLLERATCVLTRWGGGKRFGAKLLMDETRLRETIGKLARQVNRPHKDARLRVVDNRLEVRPEGCGIRVNQEVAARTVSRAVTSGQALVPIPIEIDRPDVTAEDAATIDTLLSRFSTSFNPAKRGRTHNLRLASNTLSGVVLNPGMRFSANDTIGPRLVDRGFRTAQIFVNGKLEEGLGGGVCQVSSTLYNAVLLAGLKVLERGHHSRLVPYVTAGRDATVAYDLIDLRFENTNSHPIALIAQLKGTRLTIDIYGSASDKKEVEVYTSTSKWKPAPTKTVRDLSLPAGARKLIEKGSGGVSVVVHRKITFPDGKASTEVVSRDLYLPQTAVIAVGSKPRQQPQAVPTSAAAPPESTDTQVD